MQIWKELWQRMGFLLGLALYLTSTGLQAQNPEALLVVKNGSSLNAMDTAFRNRLQALGYEVTPITATSTTISSANGKSLVVVSGSVVSGDVNTKFRDTTVPVVCLEQGLYDDLKMTGSVSGTDYGTAGSQSTLTIADSSSPLAAGLSGNVPLASAARTVYWGKPSTTASVIATQTGNSTRSLVFTYEKGTQMVGLAAPGRRVGFFMSDTGSDDWTSEVWDLFDAAIDWAGRVSPALFVVGNSTLNTSDQLVKSRLESLGFNLTIKSAASSTSADATGMSLVIISASVNSGDVSTKFTSSAVPVVTWEFAIWNYLGMVGSNTTADRNTISSQTQVKITNPTHPLAARRSGTVTVASAASAFYWGKALASAIKVGEQPSNATQGFIYAYEQGAALQGLTAPARRVALFPQTTALAALNDSGWAFFDAAMRWAVLVPSTSGDTDQDGLADAWETKYFGNLSQTGSNDPDGDGLSNEEEQSLGTNPLSYDTDGDGILDGQDTNPLDVLVLREGNNQIGATNAYLPNNLTVRVNQSGLPLAGKPVNFSITQGGGSLSHISGSTLSSSLTATSAANGEVSIRYKTPDAFSSTNKITAKVIFGSSTNSVTFTEFTVPEFTIDERIPPNGLLTWFRADSGIQTNSLGRLTRWFDRSGNSNDATSSSSAAAPKFLQSSLNGLPSVSFDGIGNMLAMPSGFSNFSTGVTAFVVARPKTPGAKAAFLELGNGPSSNNLIFSHTGTNSALTVAVYNGTTRRALEQPSVVTSNGWQVLGLSLEESKLASLSRNGQTLKTGVTTNMVTVVRTRNQIGKSTWSADPYFKGEIAELLLFSRALNEDESRNVSDYLSTKYNLGFAKAQRPVITPNGGTLEGGENVWMETSTIGAEIRYTLDGSTPSASSLLYDGPFYLSTTATIKARAFRAGYKDSEIALATFIEKNEMSPASVAGLKLWLRADAGTKLDSTGRVVDWQDQGPDSASAVQTNLMSRPWWVTNAVGAAIRFDGTNSFLKLPSGFEDFSQGMTAFVVGQFKGTGNRAAFFDLGNGGKAHNLIFAHTGNKLQFATYQGSKSNQVEKASIVSGTKRGIYAMTHNGYWTTLYTNITTTANLAPTSITNVFRSKNQIGKGLLSSDTYLQGEVSEIIIFNRNIYWEEQQRITDYLAARHGVYAPAVSAPVITPGSGPLVHTVGIKISSKPSNAEIYYTADGTTPTTASERYIGPFTLQAPVTLKAKAFLQGFTSSPVTTVNYTQGTLSSPAITPASGAFPNNSDVLVSIITPEPGAKVYYTTNGATPSINSAVYNGPFAIRTPKTIKAYSVLTGAGDSPVKTVSLTKAKLKTPSIMPEGGEILPEQSIYITPQSPGSIVRYTVDGSTPTSSSLAFTTNFYITPGATVKARAFQSGFDASDVVSEQYFKSQASVPQIVADNVAPYPSTRITISSSHPGAQIRYTTDGSIPSTSSSLYSAPFVVTPPKVIQAKAFSTAFNESPVGRLSLGEPSVAAPIIEPALDYVPAQQAVTMSANTPGAKIYYTLNGSQPTTASLVYTNGFKVTPPIRVRARANLAGVGWGGETEMNYQLLVDSDGDGMLDSYEQTTFGNLNQNGTGDYDGDGISNLEEFRRGTDASNPASKIQHTSRQLIIYRTGNGTYYGTVTVHASPNNPKKVYFAVGANNEMKNETLGERFYTYEDGWKDFYWISQPTTFSARYQYQDPIPPISQQPASMIAGDVLTHDFALRVVDWEQPNAGFVQVSPTLGDFNRNAIPDYADGFNLYSSMHHSMVFPILRTLSFNFEENVNQAFPDPRFVFRYAGSDPGKVTRTATAGGYNYTPAPGYLRVWGIDAPWRFKEPATKWEEKKYYAPGKPVSFPYQGAWNNLGRFAVEGVGEEAIGKTESLVVEFYPDYKNQPNGFVSDTVSIRYKPTIECAVDGNADSQISFTSGGLGDRTKATKTYVLPFDGLDDKGGKLGGTHAVSTALERLKNCRTLGVEFGRIPTSGSVGQLGFRLRKISGDPRIQLFPAVETGGTMNYLTSESAAQAQLVPSHTKPLVSAIGASVIDDSMIFTLPPAHTADVTSSNSKKFYIMQALSPGKAILEVHIPTRNGYDEVHLDIQPNAMIQIGVDANRDGNVTFDGRDDTTPEKPFTFWINDDDDGNGVGYEPRVSSVNSRDAFDPLGKIWSKRDLEDFTQLLIKLDSQACSLIQNQGYKLVFENEGMEVNFLKAVTTGNSYITTLAAAQTQINSYPFKVSGVNITSAIKPEEILPNTPIPFLFEGKIRGKGTIRAVLKSPTGEVAATAKVNIRILQIKEMYEVATLGDKDGAEPFPVAIEKNVVPVDPDGSDQVIIFIHGINNTYWALENSTETILKRLWHQGYRGRIVGFRWPCRVWGVNPNDYNSSEFIAHKSGIGLSRYLNKLRGRFPTAKIGMVAHSQGNNVVMQALKEQIAGGYKALDNYVASQAAIPSHCYNPQAPNFEPLVNRESLQPTPDVYRGYASNFRSALRGSFANFYNEFDFALQSGDFRLFYVFHVPANWIHNQENSKPDTGFGYRTDGTRAWWVYPESSGEVAVTDPREILAHVARSRSRTIGADALGWPASSVNIGRDSASNYTDSKDDHGGQFSRPIQQTQDYYNSLLTELSR